MSSSHGKGVRGVSSSRGAHNRICFLGDRQNLEVSSAVVMGTLSIFSPHIIHALLDLGSTLLYITRLIDGKFRRVSELLIKPFEVSTPLSESFIDRRSTIIV